MEYVTLLDCFFPGEFNESNLFIQRKTPKSRSSDRNDNKTHLLVSMVLLLLLLVAKHFFHVSRKDVCMYFKFRKLHTFHIASLQYKDNLSGFQH